MSTFTDEIFGMVCYTVSSKHNPREGVFCYETRENLEIHVLFRGAGADFVRCASRAHRCRAARRVQKAAVLQPVRNVWPVSVLPDSRGAAAVCRMAVDCGGCEEKANRVHNGACGVSLCVFGCGISGLSCRGLPAFDGIRTEKISIAVRKRTFLRFEGSFSITICRNRERVLHMRKTGKFCRFIGSFLSFVQYYA